MKTQADRKSRYKPVRRDLLDKLASLFMPARTTSAIAAAIKVCEQMPSESRLELACQCEREYAASLSNNAIARNNARTAAKS